MGCTSSTEIITDPYTGKETKKKRLGGAYPGQRRPDHAPFAPSFANGQTTETAHFVAHGGGNALTLARPDGSAIPPATGRPEKEYIQVTLPDGVKAGDTIHVQAPSGKTNAIIMPAGFGPGSTFTVEFADETPAPDVKPDPTPNYSTPQPATAVPPTPPQQHSMEDDGFASGFNNPHWQPNAAAEPEVHVTGYHQTASTAQSYPTATATPVYKPGKY